MGRAGGKAGPGLEMDRGFCQREDSGQPGTAGGGQVIQLEISIFRNSVHVPELTQLYLFLLLTGSHEQFPLDQSHVEVDQVSVKSCCFVMLSVYKELQRQDKIFFLF